MAYRVERIEATNGTVPQPFMLPKLVEQRVDRLRGHGATDIRVSFVGSWLAFVEYEDAPGDAPETRSALEATLPSP